MPDQPALTPIGTVAALYRYPVKSMRGERRESASVSWHGLDGDRRYAFVRADAQDSGFPWLSGRTLGSLITYTPAWLPAEAHRPARLAVTTPGGRSLPLESPDLLAELSAAYGGPVTLLHLSRGAHDSMPVSLISTTTVATLSARSGADLEALRFRPNILIETAAAGEFPEFAWLGRLLIFGNRPDSLRLRANRTNLRCVMITLDPRSAVSNPAVLEAVSRDREPEAGIYGSTEQPGVVRAGDTIYLA